MLTKATPTTQIRVLQRVLTTMTHRELMQWTHNRDCERIGERVKTDG